MKTKWLCLTAVGIALFVALSACLQVPVFENYYLCLGYVVMAVYCFSFGTLSGTLVGVLGVVLYCLVISGLRGMPGWALGNAVIGVSLGFCFKLTKPMKSTALEAAIIAATVVGILGVKSVTESILYLQPFLVRVGKNLSACIADAVMLLISLPICMTLDRTAKKVLPALAR